MSVIHFYTLDVKCLIFPLYDHAVTYREEDRASGYRLLTLCPPLSQECFMYRSISYHSHKQLVHFWIFRKNLANNKTFLSGSSRIICTPSFELKFLGYVSDASLRGHKWVLYKPQAYRRCVFFNLHIGVCVSVCVSVCGGWRYGIMGVFIWIWIHILYSVFPVTPACFILHGTPFIYLSCHSVHWQRVN